VNIASTESIITLAILALSIIANLLQSRSVKLPSVAQPVVRKLGETSILEAVQIAERFDTPEERRVEAVKYLQRVAKRKLGYELSDSIANIIVEYGVQLYKQTEQKIAR
jgi:hypothetical protein